MKTIPTAVALLMLLLGAWHRRAPSQATTGCSTSPTNFSARCPSDASFVVDPPARTSDAPSVLPAHRSHDNASATASPPQSSWAREIRTLKSLASHDQQAALTAATRPATKEERDDAVMAVCIEIARRDPARTVPLAWDFQRDQFDSPGAQPGRENDALRDHIFKGLASIPNGQDLANIDELTVP